MNIRDGLFILCNFSFLIDPFDIQNWLSPLICFIAIDCFHQSDIAYRLVPLSQGGFEAMHPGVFPPLSYSSAHI